MKPSKQQHRSKAHAEILWDSFKELAEAIGRDNVARFKEVSQVLLRYVELGKPLDDEMRRLLMEVLK